METTTEAHGTTAATSSFNLDAMGLGPPARTRRRGQIDKWTRILGVAVVLTLVFNIGVRMGRLHEPEGRAPDRRRRSPGRSRGRPGRAHRAPGPGRPAAGRRRRRRRRAR